MGALSFRRVSQRGCLLLEPKVQGTRNIFFSSEVELLILVTSHIGGQVNEVARNIY